MEVESVQFLSLRGIKELPEKFVHLANERPENTTAIEGVSVPVISLSQTADALVNNVSSACSQWGFFLVTDHCISASLIRRLQDVGEEFFQLPQKAKEGYASDPSSGRFEGYDSWMTPSREQKVEEVTEEYTKEILKVSDEILELLSQGLGLEGKTLKADLGGEAMEYRIKILLPQMPRA
uniref:Non-haem dioxygenase N-terminal domain-containing protein n=1 Tax=Nelumbo nucifera TaxID=4432 RepID=A0A822ZCR7_NELNU|nr:TPA_asm: hypothetical protein HUJ06_013671 [Nelumbo nucifera]